MPIMPPTAAQQPSYPSDREALWKAVRALEQRLERPAPPAQAKTGVVTTSRPTVRVLGASVDRDVWRVNSGAALEVGDEVVCVETALGLVVLSVVEEPPLGPYVPPAPSGPYFFDDFNRANAADPGNGWSVTFDGGSDGGILDGELFIRDYWETYVRSVPLDYFRVSFTIAKKPSPYGAFEVVLGAEDALIYFGRGRSPFTGNVWRDDYWYVATPGAATVEGVGLLLAAGDRVSVAYNPDDSLTVAVNGATVTTVAGTGLRGAGTTPGTVGVHMDSAAIPFSGNVVSIDDFQIDDLTT